MTHPLVKLLILGINELVGRDLISLSPTNDENDFGHILVDIAGRSSVVIWRDIGCGELRVSVWFDLDMSRHPQAHKAGKYGERFLTASPLAKREHFAEFVGATTSSYLDRKKSPCIQGAGRGAIFQTYIRRGLRPTLEAIPEPVPRGFAVNRRGRA